ncbi:MAG: thymidine phosphorylase [Clostridia bacterium]|nr:thymidine phosphorylase [Clostridia bacterium]
MRMYDIIRRKRDGEILSEKEIQFFVRGYASGEIPDYQASALCMAIYFRGMTVEETTALTLAIRDSGDRLDFSNINGLRVDKHSTGGVGDKTSLVVAPIVASLGIKVAKMSGRGLGHTGGTIDKLEAIPGFCTDIPTAEFEEIVNRIGIAIVGQTATLAPADKSLYALRDVTATVDSMPLIASSIMGKKLAADDDCIVLDVKTGSGSFMKTEEASEELARLMVGIGKQAGKKICALLTDMDKPLGNAVGNAIEVWEAVRTLQGEGPEDLVELCIALAAHMLYLADKGDLGACERMAKEAIGSGRALATLIEMVRAQGGDVSYIETPDKLLAAKHSLDVTAPKDGYIHCVDTEGYGVAALLLGAGRNKKDDVIDHCAGIQLHAKTGDFIKAGDKIATLYTNSEATLQVARDRLLAATFLSNNAPAPRPLIYKVIE